MSERIVAPELQKLFDAGAEVYSISRLNCINQCQYQAYLSYIKEVPKSGNCWSNLGGATHDALEACVKDGADESIIDQAIDKELQNLEVLGMDFPLDRNGNPTLREHWIANMKRFAKEWKTPKGEFATEQLILYPFADNIWIQGYIDLVRYNKDGSIDIYDYKTSSNYDKQHALEAGRQLILYAIAKEAEGYKVNKIAWVMLKYCKTVWKLKNGSTKEKISEWRNYIKDLRSVLEKKLADMGYDEIDTDSLLHQAIKDNTMDCLPEEIRKQFKTSIYVREYPITPDIIQECKDYIQQSIDLYHQCGRDEDNFKSCDIKKDSYFCSSLCDFKDHCKYWQDYLSQFQTEYSDDEEDDLF